MKSNVSVPKAVKDRDRELWSIARSLGLTRYDSVRPCIRCGEKLRYVINQGCVACANSRTKRIDQKRRRIGHAMTHQEALDSRQPYFFPSHRCKHGHLSRWSTRLNECMMCVKGRRSKSLNDRMAAAERTRDDLLRLAGMTEEQILACAE